MFKKHNELQTHLQRNDTDEMEHPAGEYLQTPEELTRYLQFAYCIKCGACMAACPTLATDPDYLGPMPLAQCQRYCADTRDAGFDNRKQVAGDRHGAFRCHYAGECSRVCPKGVDPARAIQWLKRSLVLDYLRLRKGQQPAALAGPDKDAKRREGIPEPPEYTVEGA
jgi:succinate dehydrogenase / fumarate reductase iron-sulfur subunit